MSRIARAVFRLTRAFGADPALTLTRDELAYLAELDSDELDAVIAAMVDVGVFAMNGGGFRSGDKVGVAAGPPCAISRDR